MTRKPNFWKCLVGVFVIALLFVGTLATTTTRLTNAKKVSAQFKTPNPAAAKPLTLSAVAAPTPGGDPISSVFEVDGDIADNPAGAPDDWATVNCDGGTAQVKTFKNDGLGATIFTQGGSKDPSDIGVFNSKGVLQPAAPA